MKIGIPKEIKPQENRVALAPHNVPELVETGHEILVETKAGAGSGFSDKEYETAGARILASPAEVFAQADMIVKVKEPIGPEFKFLRKGQILFTYLHLASSVTLTRGVLDSGVIAIGYETVEEEGGRLPLLAPMSVVAGRMAPLLGGYFLGKYAGGRGICIAGASGVPPGTIVILGGGVAGLAAAKVSAGFGCSVILLEVNPQRISYLEDILPYNVAILRSNQANIWESVPKADILIGTVLIPGAKAPVLIPEELVKKMQPGSVIIDISIDQGGCIATIHPTTHQEPTFVKHGVVHYGVTNMPGAYPRTSTIALTNATVPYIHQIAEAAQDWKSLVARHPAIKKGINTFKGHLTCAAVAAAVNLPHESLESVLN
jgi:alanine dehydrogenase